MSAHSFYLESADFKPLRTHIYKDLLTDRLRCFFRNKPLIKKYASYMNASHLIELHAGRSPDKKTSYFTLEANSIARLDRRLLNFDTPMEMRIWKIAYLKMSDLYEDLPLKKVYFHIERISKVPQGHEPEFYPSALDDPFFKEEFQSFDDVDGLIDYLYDDACLFIDEYYAEFLSQGKGA